MGDSVKQVCTGIATALDDAAAARTDAGRRQRADRDRFGPETTGVNGALPPAASEARTRVKDAAERTGARLPAAPTAPPRIKLHASPDRFDRSFVCRIVPELTGGGPDTAFPGIEVKRLLPRQGGGEPVEEAVAADRYTLTPRANDLLVQFKDDGCYRIAPKAAAGLEVDARRDGCVVVVDSQGPLFFLELGCFSTREGRPVEPSPFPFLATGEFVMPRGTVRDPNGVRKASLAVDPRVKVTPPAERGGRPTVERAKLLELDLVTRDGSRLEGDALRFDVGSLPLPPGFHVIECRAQDAATAPLMGPTESAHAEPAPAQGGQELASQSGKEKGALLGVDEMTSKMFRSCVVGEYGDPTRPIEDALVWNLGNDLLRVPGDMLGMIMDRVGLDALVRGLLKAAGIDARKAFTYEGKLVLGISVDRDRAAADVHWDERLALFQRIARAAGGAGAAVVAGMIQSELMTLGIAAPAALEAPLPLRLRAFASGLLARAGEAAANPGRTSAILAEESARVARLYPLRTTRAEDMPIRARSVSAATSPFHKSGFLLTIQPEPLYLDLDVNASGYAGDVVEKLRSAAVQAVKWGIIGIATAGAALPVAAAAVAAAPLAAPAIGGAIAAKAAYDSVKDYVSAPKGAATDLEVRQAQVATREREAARLAAITAQRAEEASQAFERLHAARARGARPEETAPLLREVLAKNAARDAAAKDEEAARAQVLVAQRAVAALEAKDESSMFLEFLARLGGGIEGAAAAVVDTYVAPALRAMQPAIAAALHFGVRLDLLPLREPVHLLLAPESLTSIEVCVGVGDRLPSQASADAIEALFVEAIMGALGRLVADYFRSIAGVVERASSEVFDTLYLAKATADGTAYDIGHAAYDLYYKYCVATSDKDYETFRREHEARKEEVKRGMLDAAVRQRDEWDACARVALDAAQAWANAKVRTLLGWFAEALKLRLSPAKWLSEKIERAAAEALVGGELELRLGNPTSAKLRMSRDSALLLSTSGLELLAKPFDAAAKERIASSNPSLLLHVDPARGGEAVVRYDLAALAAMLGASVGDVQAKLAGDAAASFVGGLELVVKGRPRFEFRDDGATLSLDASVDARRAGLEAPCRACEGRGTLTRTYDGRDETVKCHVCAGVGRTRRGRGPLAVTGAARPSGGTGMGVHAGFLHQVAYALWSAGLFDLKIPKGPHALKDAIQLDAKAAKRAPGEAPPPPALLPPPSPDAKLTLVVPAEIAIGCDFEVSARRPTSSPIVHESVVIEVQGAKQVASSGELAQAGTQRSAFRARFRVNEVPQGDAPAVRITARAKRPAAAPGSPQVEDSATATVPVVARRTGRADERRGLVAQASNPAIARFGLEVAKDLADVPAILRDFSCSMQTTMPPILESFDSARFAGSAQDERGDPGVPSGARDAQGVRLSWGDVVLDLDMAWRGVPIKGRVQVACDARFRAWPESAAEAAARGAAPQKGLRVRAEALDVHVDLLTPLLGVDPDYVVLLVEWLFEILTERIVCWTLEASFGQGIFEGFVLDDIFRALLRPPATPEVQVAPPPPQPGGAAQAPPPSPAARIREAIGADVLAAVGARVREVSINPASAKGYLSVSAVVEAFATLPR